MQCVARSMGSVAATLLLLVELRAEFGGQRREGSNSSIEYNNNSNNN